MGLCLICKKTFLLQYFDKIKPFIQRSQSFMKQVKIILLTLLTLLFCNALFAETKFKTIKNLIGKNDSVIIANEKNEIIFQKNINKKLIPASILKIFTSLVAISYLGEDYKFKTEFYIDAPSTTVIALAKSDDYKKRIKNKIKQKNKIPNLKIKGYGDPHLTSREIEKISKKLKSKIKRINNIILDDSFYAKPLVIDGVKKESLEPYDSPNGAICVNFNTVAYKKMENEIINGEKETPLLPFIVPKLRKLKAKKGRVVLSEKNGENLIYAGKLFNYFLKKQGIKTSGNISFEKVKKEKNKLILTHLTPFNLKKIIQKLLKYSNNFISNQIFLNIGGKIYGEPATIQKGVDALKLFAENNLQIKNFDIVEGSGISRKNKITTLDMLKILNGFAPHYKLLPEIKKNFFCKTGTLTGIRTRAGFFKVKNKLYRVIIIMNENVDNLDMVVRKTIKILTIKST